MFFSTTAVTPEEMVLLTLRYLAIGSILQVVGDFCGLHKSTACRIIAKVLKCIARQCENFIKMPSNEREVNDVKERFYLIA